MAINFIETAIATVSNLYKSKDFIIEIISQIEVDTIDNNRSSIKEENDLILINLFAINNKCCPITILLGIGKNYGIVNFFYNNSSPIIEERFKSNGECLEIKDSIIGYLKSTVKEELSYVGQKLVKATYYYTIDVSSTKGLALSNSIYKRPFYFLHSKMSVRNEYTAWI